MRLVVVESPYAGDVERNLSYLRACLADCLRRNEAPIASHALYTQPGVLDDTKPEERKKGMMDGVKNASELPGKLEIERRVLGGEWAGLWEPAL